MASYDSAKTKAFAKATTTSITGVPLDVSADYPLRQAGNLPIQVCVCVTDPCPCDDHPIIWVDESAVRGRTATGRRTTGGDDLVEFAIDAEASVVVESFRSVKASDASSIAGLSQPAAPAPVIVRRRSDGGRSANEGSPCQDSSPVTRSADRGCNDVEIFENGAVYCFYEASEHYCIYLPCR